MRRQAFENRSTTVRIVVWPLELGRSVMKSTAMWDQGRSGMGRGWRRPAGNCREGFWVLQTWQWLMWEMVSFLRVGHQKRFWSNCTVALMPGWPELRAAWTSAMVLSRRVSGTNNLFSGQSGGISWLELACSISDDVPLNGCDDDRWGNDILRRAGFWIFSELPRECVRLDVLCAGSIRDYKIKSGEK